MPAEHLIPTLKTVERGGKSHQQIYWTKAAELRAAVAVKGFKAADQFGGDSAKYGQYINSWSGSSHTALAGEWRGVVGKAMGLSPTDLDHDRKYLKDKNVSALTSLNKGYAVESDSQAVKNVVAAAAVAQSMYEKPTVTLYRGIHSKQASMVQKAIGEGASHVDVPVGSIASWTESYDVAKGFSGGHGGVVMKLEVPREAILASWRVPGTPLAGTVTDEHSSGGEQEVLFASRGSVQIAAADVREGHLSRPAGAPAKSATHAAAKAQLAAAKSMPEVQAAKTAAQKQAESEQAHEKQGKKYLDEMIAAASPGHPKKAESDALHQKWQEHKAQIGITYPAPGQKEKFYADQKKATAAAPPVTFAAPAPVATPAPKPLPAAPKIYEESGMLAEAKAISGKKTKTGYYEAAPAKKWAQKHFAGQMEQHVEKMKAESKPYKDKVAKLGHPDTTPEEKAKLTAGIASQLKTWKFHKAQSLMKQALKE